MSSVQTPARAPAARLIGAVAQGVWPHRGDRHGPLVPVMLVLTILTGVVDAASYLKLGHVFVANMTGNVVFLGFALAGAHGLSARQRGCNRTGGRRRYALPLARAGTLDQALRERLWAWREQLKSW